MGGWIRALVGALTGVIMATAGPNMAQSQSVEFMWSGGATHESIEVKARLDNVRVVRLAVSASPDLSNPVLSDGAVASEARDRVASLSISGLMPDTRYYYAIRETDGTLNQPFGSFRTLPAPGCQAPYDFTIVLGSDASVGSNALVFEAAQSKDPDLLLHLGGLHYADIESNAPADFQAAYQTALTRPRQAAFYRNVNTAYVWDDHDLGPNDSDSTLAGREAAKLVFTQYVPSHPLVSIDTDAGVYRAFTVGRSRIIITDARFHRSPKTDVDNASKTMLGPTQKQWLKDELLAARDQYAAIIWVNPVPWIEETTAESDRWGGYSTEREELAQFIADNGIDEKLLMLSADAHMIAVDDGSFSGYASGGHEGGFPVIQSAAFDRPGSYQGGPYRRGAAPGTMRYGLLTLTDECADRVDVSYEGLGSLDQSITSTQDYLVGENVTFQRSFFAGGTPLVTRSTSWRLQDDGELPGVNWQSPNFIATGWKTGTGQFGYGDAPEGEDPAATDAATEVSFGFFPQTKHLAYYFRSFFEVEDRTEIRSLVGNLLFDDGAIVYLNGFEVARLNMPEGVVDNETAALEAIDDADEAAYLPLDLSAGIDFLSNGTNVLAVEIHQVSRSDDDLSFDMQLYAVTSEEAANIKPVAVLRATPETGDAPLEVTFDASESSDIDGSIESYSLNFGDGVTSGQPVVSHTYDTTGTYTAILTVTDNLGRTDVAMLDIVVTNAPPEPVLLVAPMTGETPLTVEFDGSQSVDPNGTIDSFLWAFDTGDSAFGAEVSYVYETPGIYWPKLTVTDNFGVSATDSVQLDIAQGNLPPFLVKPAELRVPEDTSSVGIDLSDFFEDDRDDPDQLRGGLQTYTNETLFASVIVDVGFEGTARFQAAADSNGTSGFVFEAVDTGGLTTVDTIWVIIEPVNDAPTFTRGPDTLVTTDAGPVTIEGWAADISVGPPNEEDQSVQVDLVNPAPGLFAAPPTLSLDGTLTFEPAADTSGIAAIEITLRDDGGVERGGVDSSQTAILTIQTNHRPTADFEFIRDGYGSLTVNFDAAPSQDPDGTITSYAWDFGDGSTGEGAQVSHAFADTMLTEVTLTVTDNLGAEASASSGVSVATEDDVLPEAFYVGEFYPNPVSGSARLEAALPEARRISVTLVDAAGRVALKRSFESSAGTYDWQFDVSNLPSGLYLARLELGKDVAVRQVTIIR